MGKYTPPQSLASAALTYAKAGWHVFPLKPRAKDPLHGGGVNDATTDPDKIKKWWAKSPNANIGIAIQKSSLAVVDLDVKPAKGIDGRKTLADLELAYGDLDRGTVQITPSGGRHLLYKRPRRPMVDKVAWEPGIDILTRGHRYIVAAPSRTDQGAYQWHGAAAPWETVGELPPEWAGALILRGPASAPRDPNAGPMDLLDTAALRVPGVGLEELDAVLAVLDPSCTRDEWLRVIWGAAAQWAGSKEESEVIEKIEEWSSETDKPGQYKQGEVATRWREHSERSGGTTGGGHTTWRSVRAKARELGWTPETIRGVDPKKWKDALQYKVEQDRKVLKATPWNATLFLAFHEDFRGGVRRNLLNDAIEIHRPELAPLHDKARFPAAFDKDADWIGVAHAIAGKIPGFGTADATIAAVRAAAKVHAYDPMKQWIDGLTWDGTARLDGWLHRVCGVPDSALNRGIGRAWMVGLAARASAEADGRGVKMDSVLVLQGGEGIGKSSVGAILGGDWFAEFSASLNGDEAFYVIEKSMVLEFGELDALSRSEATRVKSLVTSQVDTFRRKFATQATPRPRRCVFIGTTNEVEFLGKDMTTRRWWVVPCGTRNFDLRWLRDNRDQLIAEAKAAWDAGELPMLPEEVRGAHKQAVSAVQTAHPFEELINEWTATQTSGAEFSKAGAVEEVLKRSMGAMSGPDLKRFNGYMYGAGWEVVHAKGRRFWRLV